MSVHIRLLAIGLFSLACVGCLRIPYCLPELDHVSSVETKCSSSDVKAVRADVESSTELIHGPCFGFSGAKKKEVWRLTPVEASVDGVVPGQWSLGWEHGRRYVGFWNYRDEWTTHAVTLRLYRPGFKTIVLASGDDTRNLKWEEASSLSDREQAIDDWLGASLLKRQDEFFASADLTLETVQHLKVLGIAVDEYRNLEVLMQDSQQGERLIEKASHLESLVKKHSLP